MTENDLIYKTRDKFLVSNDNFENFKERLLKLTSDYKPDTIDSAVKKCNNINELESMLANSNQNKKDEYNERDEVIRLLNNYYYDITHDLKYQLYKQNYSEMTITAIMVFKQELSNVTYRDKPIDYIALTSLLVDCYYLYLNEFQKKASIEILLKKDSLIQMIPFIIKKHEEKDKEIALLFANFGKKTTMKTCYNCAFDDNLHCKVDSKQKDNCDSWRMKAS